MIFIIGGTGILGAELKKIDDSLICIGSEYDIFTFSALRQKLGECNPDIVVNLCASKTTEDPIKSINVNIIGSSNISKYCIENSKRLVYISTDYVYPGTDGNYKETDSLLPFNDYAWTKLGGESSTRLVENHLIIRTSFGESTFKYDAAWDNQIVSKDYVDVIAPKILTAIKSNLTGILNIGTEPKTMYEYATKRNTVGKKSLTKSLNFSLNNERYKNSLDN